jgi:hypothetical protein
MKTISFPAFTNAGCMVIFDPASEFQVTDEWLHCLNHVTDPDGLTHLNCDYPEGEWPSVWLRNVAKLRQMSRHGEFTLLLCDEVEHACRVSDGLSPAESQRLRTSYEEWVYAPSGQLVIADAMAAFSDEPMEEDPFAQFPVTPGWNKVIIQSLMEPSGLEHVEGFEGNEEFPALVFRVCTADTKSTEIIEEKTFPRVKINHTRSIGTLCEATVIAIECGTAKLELHASRSTTSGWGRMTTPESEQIHVGDCLLVRLIEDNKAYWRVERP